MGTPMTLDTEKPASTAPMTPAAFLGPTISGT